MPFKRIAAELGLSPSTVHLWTRDIELTPAQIAYNLRGPKGPQNPEHVAKRMASWAARSRERRLEHQQQGRARARLGDPLHASGCMLYWAEGAKERNVLKLCNSDAAMIRHFCRFLRKSLGVGKERLKFSLNVYTNNGLSIREIEDHWLGLLKLPRTCLRKHQLNSYPTSSSGQRRCLPFGVCTLSVSRSTPELQHIYGAIQEYAGFDEPKWLDGPPRKPRAKASRSGT